MSRDMMPSFELYQPDTLGERHQAGSKDTEGAWVLAGGQDSYDWFKDRVKHPGALIDLERHRRAQGHAQDRRGTRDRRADHVDGSRAARRRAGELRTAGRRRGPRGQPADPQRRDARRQPLPGRALLVLPLRASTAIAPAATPATPIRRQGQNREHRLFGAARCIAGAPSDTRAGGGRARGQDRHRTASRASVPCRRRSSSSDLRWISAT